MLMLGIILVVVLVLMLTTLIIIFSSSNFGTDALIVQTIFTVAVVFVFLVYYTLQGALANGELELHK